MRVLVVTIEPAWVEALKSCLSATDSVVAADVRQIAQNPAFAGACDACFVAEAAGSTWTVETLKQLSAVTDTPLFVLTDGARGQGEETMLFAGAQQVFRRPLRGAMIQLAITRCPRRGPEWTPPSPSAAGVGRASELAEPNAALLRWRDFSRLLRHAATPERLVDEYVRSLRDVLRCSRLFLYVLEAGANERVFRCACAHGVEAREFEGFHLNQRTGVAQVAAERATVVWRHQLRPDAAREAMAARELQAFGAELAIPVMGREGVTALLLVGPRISGDAYSDDEVTLVYHAIEGLAPVLGRPAETRAGTETPGLEPGMVLQGIPMAAALVSPSLRLMEVNAAFRSLLGRTEACEVKFDELPPSWTGPITAAVQNGADSARVELEHRTLGGPRKLRLGVRRLGAGAQPGGFLVTLEEALPALLAAQEADAHNMHNLLQRVGEQLSNEFRNALTPVDIMVQLSRDTSTSRDELERLGTQVDTAIHRLRRRIDDLAYLTKNAIIPEPTSVGEVMRFTRERLDDWLEPRHLKRIVWLNEFSPTALMADGRALALAVAELVMNAIEASEGRQVTVTAEDSSDVVSIRVRNSGTWAPPPESSGFRHRPFISNKSTGVGLGIEVASRVAENHGGRLAIGPVSADVVEAILRVPRSSTAAGPREVRPATKQEA
ncbi:GAF domain-containing sensor histidine kinase [Opitutus sp. ER46]|uniref:GAF domain-containing sensor histidine kinase n=1 Tax=Opitutus sp. ER46 TaxID=2161864 RepID=UPI000D30478A|nr:GAF domain-containing sensor histidine kinase [Opitutus sp. ER46]PTX92533.1 hypothetical protein DB354_14480 [Opitutus sp. ER46]